MNECALWPTLPAGVALAEKVAMENVFVPLSNSVQHRAKNFLEYLTNLLKSLSRRRMFSAWIMLCAVHNLYICVLSCMIHKNKDGS